MVNRERNAETARPEENARRPSRYEDNRPRAGICDFFRSLLEILEYSRGQFHDKWQEAK
jgi:hypothetical protein